MNRSDFLKSLGLGSAGLLLPTALAENRPIKIYDNYVAGLQHYRFSAVQGKIGEGDPLIMKREPLNVHDSFAVELYWQESKLGYLPAYENIVLCGRPDRFQKPVRSWGLEPN